MSARSDAGTAQAENSLYAMRLPEKCRSFVYARLHGISTVARTYEHLVGAYGVVGLSGVKDARRAFSSPTLQRRPARLVEWCICCANGVHVLDRYWTKTGHSPGLLTRDADA